MMKKEKKTMETFNKYIQFIVYRFIFFELFYTMKTFNDIFFVL